MEEVKELPNEGRELNKITTQCHDTFSKSVNKEQCQRINNMLDARDIKIIQRSQRMQKAIYNKYHISEEMDEMKEEVKDEVREWLVNVYEESTSDAFNKYHRGQLQEGQGKAYAAKNYLANITLLMQSIKHKNNHLSQKLFKFIDQQSKEIINQLILKYPQSEAKASNKQLKKAIQRPDNKEKDEYDLLLNPKHTGISFKYKENGNYSSEIMKTLNYVMQLANKPTHPINEFDTNFNLFTMSGCPQFQEEFFKDAKKYQQAKDQKQQQKYELFQKLFNSEDPKQQKYKKVIQKQCHFETGQKIPSNVKLFSEQEIESGIFRVPDMTVLRVMTKWSEQLKQKITSSYQLIKRRVEKFKTKNGQLIQLNQQQQQVLCLAIKQQQKQVDKIVKLLKQHYQIIVTKILQDNPKSLYTNEIDGAVEIFAARTQTCIGKYMFEYLKALIHSLMKVPMRAKQILKQIHTNKKIYYDQKRQNQIQQLNLISFKIGDLLRAKCKSSEKHIINIFKMLNKMNEKCPKIMRFVRVKDRLDGKDNDLLINLFFMDKIQCEIQLSVTTDINPKQQHYNSFNHFIYQLKRAQFGPIAQCACILSQYDPAIKNYCQRQQLSPKIKIQQIKQINRQQYLDNNKQQKQKSIINNLPYFCSVCNKFDRNKNQQFYQNKIHNKQFKQCNNCYQKYLNKKNKQQLMKQLLREKYNEKQIQTFINHYQIINNKQISSWQEIKKQIKQGLIISSHLHQPRYLHS